MDDIIGILIICGIIFFLIAEFFGRSKHIGRGWTFFLLLGGIIPGLIALIASPSAKKKPTKGSKAHRVFGVILLVLGGLNLILSIETDNSSQLRIAPAFIILGIYLIRLSRGEIVNENPKFYFSKPKTKVGGEKEFRPENRDVSKANYTELEQASLRNNKGIIKDLFEKGILSKDEYYEKLDLFYNQELHKELIESDEYLSLKQLLNQQILSKEEFWKKCNDLKFKIKAKRDKQQKNQFGIKKFMNDNLDYGFKDSEGNIVIQAKYEFAEEFCCGLALIRKNRKFGFIDINEKIVIDFIYDYADSFKNNKAFVKLNGESFHINPNGKRIKG